ncbi:hypothetical protein [Marinomonas transparens]|uniref:Uncharacterized protein n=1 Tax=Marinomonas transparens TaxID=2795388 RepID=A0A934JNV7_9GAMM|nr:hypothetical protein [Marinomonas transparens]MBJ7537913.1 hypothetical protein [Marinomonas transparens]
MSFYEELKESLEQAIAIHNERQLIKEIKIAELQLSKEQGTSNQEAKKIILRRLKK